jgi:hypothetical protein
MATTRLGIFVDSLDAVCAVSSASDRLSRLSIRLRRLKAEFDNIDYLRLRNAWSRLGPLLLDVRSELERPPEVSTSHLSTTLFSLQEDTDRIRQEVAKFMRATLLNRRAMPDSESVSIGTDSAFEPPMYGFNDVRNLHRLATKTPSAGLQPYMPHAVAERLRSDKRPHAESLAAETPARTNWADVEASMRNPDLIDEQWAQLRVMIWENSAPLIPFKSIFIQSRQTLEVSFLELLPRPFHFERDALLLKNLVSTLGRLCAPFRDAEVEKLSAFLDHLSAQSPTHFDWVSNFVFACRSVVDLCQSMRGDLANFDRYASDALETSDDPQGLITSLLRSEAGVFEKDVVLHACGWGAVRRMTLQWMETKLRRPVDPNRFGAGDFGEAILSAAFDTRTVIYKDPTSTTHLSTIDPGHVGFQHAYETSNMLPPVLCVQTTDMVNLQRQIQATCTLACLYVVAGETSAAWGERMASLIFSRTLSDTQTVEDVEIVDWLVTTLKEEDATAAAVASPEALKKLKNDAMRVLQPVDPVFQLLRNRLKAGLVGWLKSKLELESQRPVAPPTMATGRVRPAASTRQPTTAPVPQVLGFDRSESLRDAVAGISQRASDIMTWSMSVWEETLRAPGAE